MIILRRVVRILLYKKQHFDKIITPGLELFLHCNTLIFYKHHDAWRFHSTFSDFQLFSPVPEKNIEFLLKPNESFVYLERTHQKVQKYQKITPFLCTKTILVRE